MGEGGEDKVEPIDVTLFDASSSNSGQAIAWTTAELLSFKPLETTFIAF